MTDAAVRRRNTEVADVYIQMFGAIAHVDPEDLTFLERNLGHCEGATSMRPTARWPESWRGTR